MGIGMMGGWVSSDKKLEWPYKEHSEILNGPKKVDREFVLDLLRELQKQNEHANRISAENTTLKEENKRLIKENKFLIETVNDMEG